MCFKRQARYTYWGPFEAIVAGLIAAPRTVKACLQDFIVLVRGCEGTHMLPCHTNCTTPFWFLCQSVVPPP